MENKESIEKFILAVSGFTSITWFVIYGYFFKHLNTKNMLFNAFVFLLPIVSIWVHYRYVSEKLNKSEDKDVFMEYLDEEIRAEQAFIDILPVTIFGTGILLTNFITNLDKVIHDFYLLIVFGLLVPLVITSLTFTMDNVYKKIIDDMGSFASESYAFSIFFIIFHKLFIQNYTIYKSYLVTYKDKKTENGKFKVAV